MRLVAVIALVVGAGGMMSLAWFDTLGGAEWSLTFRYLAVPLAVLAAWLSYGKGLGTQRGRLLYALAIFTMGIIFLPGWLVLANALGGDGAPVVVEGPIVEKYSSTGRGSTIRISVRDETTGKVVRLPVIDPEYRSVNVGDRFRREFHRGLLGIPYRGR